MKTDNYDRSIKSIVFRCQQGNASDFKHIVYKFYDDIRNFLLYSGISREDSDIICDDIFLCAWQAIHKFEPDVQKTDREIEEHFKNWIYRIAGWKKGDFFKKKKTRQNQFESDMASLARKNFGQYDTAFSSEASFIDKENKETKEFLMNKYKGFLSNEERMLIFLRYTEGRTYKEICYMMDMRERETNLRKKVERAMDKLHEYIIIDAIDRYFLQKRKKKVRSISEFIIDYPLNGECGEQVEDELEKEQYFIDHFCRYSPKLYRPFVHNNKHVKLLDKHYVSLQTYSEMSGSFKSALRMRRRLQKITKHIAGIEKNGESHEND